MNNKAFLEFLKGSLLKERAKTKSWVKTAFESHIEVIATQVGDQFKDLRKTVDDLACEVRSRLIDQDEMLVNRLAELKDGEKGEKGEPGSAGDQGIQGEPGPQGKTGDVGADGPMGPTGEPGPRGDKGDPGDPGIAGKDGAPGTDGAAGADGVDGANGRDGIDKFILAPRTVDAEAKLDPNEIVECNGGLYQSIRKTIGDPNNDPGSYKLVVNGIAKIDRTYDEEGGGSNITVRMSDGSVCEFGVLDGTDGKEGEKGEQGIRGRAGKPGQKGASGEKGADGVGIADIMTHEGLLVFVMSDGSHKTVDLNEVLGA